MGINFQEGQTHSHWFGLWETVDLQVTDNEKVIDTINSYKFESRLGSALAFFGLAALVKNDLSEGAKSYYVWKSDYASLLLRQSPKNKQAQADPQVLENMVKGVKNLRVNQENIKYCLREDFKNINNIVTEKRSEKKTAPDDQWERNGTTIGIQRRGFQPSRHERNITKQQALDSIKNYKKKYLENPSGENKIQFILIKDLLESKRFQDRLGQLNTDIGNVYIQEGLGELEGPTLYDYISNSSRENQEIRRAALDLRKQDYIFVLKTAALLSKDGEILLKAANAKLDEYSSEYDRDYQRRADFILNHQSNVRQSDLSIMEDTVDLEREKEDSYSSGEDSDNEYGTFEKNVPSHPNELGSATKYSPEQVKNAIKNYPLDPISDYFTKYLIENERFKSAVVGSWSGDGIETIYELESEMMGIKVENIIGDYVFLNNYFQKSIEERNTIFRKAVLLLDERYLSAVLNEPSGDSLIDKYKKIANEIMGIKE